MVSAAQKIDLAELRAGVDRIARGASTDKVLPFGLPVIDAVLPGGGLALGALHEVGAAAGDAAGIAFALALALRCQHRLGGAILWCQPGPEEHESGLLYGIGHLLPDPAAVPLLHIRAAHPLDMLWAMEEGLRTGTVAAVVGMGMTAELVTSRRLHLAARAGGRLAMLLSSGRQGALATPSVAVTRWRVASAPETAGQGSLQFHWHLVLQRSRGGIGPGGRWQVLWDSVRSTFVPSELYFSGKFPVKNRS